MTRLSGDNSNRTVLLIGTVIAAALIVLALFAVKNKSSTATSGAAANFNYASMPFDGQASAPVSVVAVEDFKCPACKNFQDTAAAQLKTKYVDSGKVKWYTLVWPFISTQVAHNPEDDSKYAAQAAKCVYDQKGNEGFNTYKDILFRAQQSETLVWATKSYLKELAGNIDGLDAAKFATCLDTDATADRVEADKKVVEAANVNSTPTFFVNGKQVTITGDPVTGLSAAIDAAANAK